MQSLANISDRQEIVFGNTENGYFWRYQNTDNQYVYNCKTTPNSTGKELDTETGFSYFGARYLDHTLTTAWLSVDPMADKYPSISPYAYCAWNPVKLVDPEGGEVSEHINRYGYVIVHFDDGDNSVYLHENGTTQYNIMCQRACLGNTGGYGKKIGELGGTIDMSDFFSNKLIESNSLCKKISQLRIDKRTLSYAKLVRTGGDWDLKNNTKTIWGVAWQFDKKNKTNTLFDCALFHGANAADVGNFHAGYTGIKSEIPPYMLFKGAGAAETVKSFKNVKLFDGFVRLNAFLAPFNIKSGDRRQDYNFNLMGMQCADFL